MLSCKTAVSVAVSFIWWRQTNGLIVQSCHARDLYAEQACHHNFVENGYDQFVWNPLLDLDADIVVIVRRTNHSPMNWDSFWDIRSMTWKDL